MTDERNPENSRVRTVTWSDPADILEAVRGMTGREAMRAFVQGDVPQPPCVELLGFTLIEAGDGLVVFGMDPAEYHYNSTLTVMGGIICSLLDAAMTHAVPSKLPAGIGYTTVEMKVNLVRPMTRETGPVRGEGRVIHLGKTLATAEGRVVDAEGKLYAHGLTTCMAR